MSKSFFSNLKKDLNQLFQPASAADKKARLILLISPILLTIWVYFGKRTQFSHYFKSSMGIPTDAAAAIFEYLTFFLLMFCIPAIIVKFVWKQPLSAYGLQAGDRHAGLPILAVLLPLMVLGAYSSALVPAVQVEYPLSKSMMHSIPLFILIEVFYLVYYFSWEFFFRGFMQTGMQNAYGPLAAILIQTIPSAIVHIGKPFAECFSAIFAGLIFGYAAWRTRSIFIPMLLHAVIGIGLDVFITMILR